MLENIAKNEEGNKVFYSIMVSTSTMIQILYLLVFLKYSSKNFKL